MTTKTVSGYRQTECALIQVDEAPPLFNSIKPQAIHDTLMWIDGALPLR